MATMNKRAMSIGIFLGLSFFWGAGPDFLAHFW